MLSSLTADDAFQIAMKFCSYRELSEKDDLNNALNINSKIDWVSSEISPNQEFEELIEFVKKLFREG